MDRIAIIGAGELGGLLAHVLARRGVARDICLIDENGRAASGKALDIMQSAPIERFASTVVGSSDQSLARGAAVVVVADVLGQGEWQGDAALMAVTRVRDFAPHAVIVCAGASHREVVELGVREAHVPRKCLIGSAPEALASGVRALVAAGLRTSPRDVSITALGIPPGQIVVPWDEAAAGGFALHRYIGETEKRRIEADAVRLWPPGPYALASAASKVIDSVLERSDRTVTCFVAPDDSAGRRVRTAALPVRVNRRGLAEVVLPDLSGRDRVRLDNAMLL